MTKDEVKEIVEKATGLRFKIAKGNANNASEEYTPELLMSTYGISVDKKNIAVYVLDRNTEDRSSLSYLEVVCIPGNVYYMWGSDRVSGDSEGFMKNTQFAKSLKGI